LEAAVSFRVALLNLHQGFKRRNQRRELVVEQAGDLRPDIWALNEISIPDDSGRWLHKTLRKRFGIEYTFLQQSKTNGQAWVEAQGILIRFP
jgi:hypothetical protein